TVTTLRVSAMHWSCPAPTVALLGLLPWMISPVPSLGDNPWYTAVGSDPAGNLCAAGTYYDANDPNDPNGTDHWFVRRSSNGGVAWSTVDDVAPFSGSWFNQANAVAADAAGDVYVAGYLNTTSTTGAWIVR